ncbi:hypothetical protein V7x_08460 [Crateriforma conspicua]|uniref:Uncharacterized protein n=1 Tax=Crateriforma conspicua TaxID=2527996 RepID=A0A5C6FV20_9PLAN|nr:hypothetical protein V7x_08460 [Crateriforma conspicua]
MKRSPGMRPAIRAGGSMDLKRYHVKHHTSLALTFRTTQQRVFGYGMDIWSDVHRTSVMDPLCWRCVSPLGFSNGVARVSCAFVAGRSRRR